MARPKSTDSILEQLTAAARADLAAALEPHLKRVAAAVAGLEEALAGRGKRPGRRPGRPAKNAAAVAAVAPALTPNGRRRGRPPGSGKKAVKVKVKAERGSMPGVIKQVLASAGKPLTAAQIRDGLMKLPAYAKRPSKSVYTQLSQTIKRIPEVRRNADGEYSLKG